MAYPLHSVKTGSNTTFVSLYVPQTREIQAFTFLEIFLQPDHAQHMHSSVNSCFIGSPQRQHSSGLSCIPWSPLKSVLGTTTTWICCAGARALLWDIPNLTLILHLHRTIPMSLLSSLALHWVKHHGQPRPWGRGESLLCTASPWRFKRVGRQGVRIVALGHSDQGQWQKKSFHQVYRRNMSWSLLLCSTGNIHPLFLQLQRKRGGHPLPYDAELCFTARRETSARPKLHKRVLVEMENQRARNSNNSSHGSSRCAPLLHASVASPPPRYKASQSEQIAPSSVPTY